MQMSNTPIKWVALPDGQFVTGSEQTYVIKTGLAVVKPRKQKKYEDALVSLCSYEQEGLPTLGYSISARKTFPKVAKSNTYVSFLAGSPHKDPELVYQDQTVYLYKFKSESGAFVYWMLYRGGKEAKNSTLAEGG